MTNDAGRVLENHSRKRFGRRRSDALQLSAGGTRFVVSQTSGASAVNRVGVGLAYHSIHVKGSRGKMPVGQTDKMSVLHVALGTSVSTI
jgi:hypothetical protein